MGQPAQETPPVKRCTEWNMHISMEQEDSLNMCFGISNGRSEELIRTVGELMMEYDKPGEFYKHLYENCHTIEEVAYASMVHASMMTDIMEDDWDDEEEPETVG